jgi:hypothetical protein
MQKKKRIYWLTSLVTDRIKALEDQLRHSGFHCDFFSSLDALMSAVAARRTTIVVLGELGSAEREITALRYLAQRPELQGVRFILTPASMNPAVMGLAAAFNFRDVLPLDLPPAVWAERFIFATSTSPDPLPQTPAMVGMNQLATLHLPARVVWISQDQIWMESRLECAVGTTLSLHGSLAEAIGLPSLKLEVVSTRNSFLFYRFSQATVCKWSVPPKFREPVQFVLRDLRNSGVGPSCRVFMAVETAALRNELIDVLPAPRFKLSAALQRHGIPIEPRYFSPDVVLIEDTLAADSGGAQFAGMMNSIEPHVPVLVLGENVEFEKLRALYHHRPVFSLPQKASIVREAIKTRFLSNSVKSTEFDRPDIVYLPPEHVLSFAEISIPARMSRLHPLQGTILTGLPVGRYALAKVESPLLTRLFNRPVFVKLTSNFKDPRPEHALHPYVAEFALSDLNQAQRAKLSAALPEYIADQMKPFIEGVEAKEQGAPATDITVPGSQQEKIPAITPTEAVAPESTPRSRWKIKRLSPATSSPGEISDANGISNTVTDTAKIIGEILDDFRAKWREDRQFRLAAQTIFWLTTTIAITWFAVRAFEPMAANSGKIWSDSFKAFQLLQGR